MCVCVCVFTNCKLHDIVFNINKHVSCLIKNAYILQFFIYYFFYLLDCVLQIFSPLYWTLLQLLHDMVFHLFLTYIYIFFVFIQILEKLYENFIML